MKEREREWTISLPPPSPPRPPPSPSGRQTLTGNGSAPLADRLRVSAGLNMWDGREVGEGKARSERRGGGEVLRGEIDSVYWEGRRGKGGRVDVRERRREKRGKRL